MGGGGGGPPPIPPGMGGGGGGTGTDALGILDIGGGGGGGADTLEAGAWSRRMVWDWGANNLVFPCVTIILPGGGGGGGDIGVIVFELCWRNPGGSVPNCLMPLVNLPPSSVAPVLRSVGGGGNGGEEGSSYKHTQ